MKKITAITSKQQEYFDILIEQYLNNLTFPTDDTSCRDAINNIYISMSLNNPIIYIFTSPFLAIIAAQFLKNQLGNQLNYQLHNQVRLTEKLNSLFLVLGDQLDDQLSNQLHDQLGYQLYNQLHGQLFSQLDNQLYKQLYNQLSNRLDSQLYKQLDNRLGNQLGSQLFSHLKNQLENQLSNQLSNQLDSQLCNHYCVLWWQYWTCYYQFAKMLGTVFDNTKYNIFCNFTKNVHTILPYNKIAICSKKPATITFKNKLLHNDTDMCVKYEDGWGWYALNGIMMKPEYVLTPANELKPKIVLSEQNVSIRAELIKKIGIDKLVNCGKIIDETDSYKLIDMASLFKPISFAPYLYMVNPSTGEIHLEGVAPTCRSIQQAINWRAGNIKVFWTPSQLS